MSRWSCLFITRPSRAIQYGGKPGQIVEKWYHDRKYRGLSTRIELVTQIFTRPVLSTHRQQKPLVNASSCASIHPKHIAIQHRLIQCINLQREKILAVEIHIIYLYLKNKLSPMVSLLPAALTVSFIVLAPHERLWESMLCDLRNERI